uniref:Uncharacterized protein n=1 Tax=Setaria viridis TaxID=4556 RepID=A0A4U6TU81_SETVI|nr:hypothetical protein SEVIR_7G101700v2 [Setaria viridis]
MAKKLGAVNIALGGIRSLQCWWMHLKGQLPGIKRKGFDTRFALITWQLWKERNVETQLALPLRMIKQEGDNWIVAGADHLGRLFSE